MRSVLLCMLLLPATSLAGSGFAEGFPRISANIDVIPYVTRGHANWLGVGVAPHWNIQVAHFSGDVPSLGVAEGWSARFRSGDLMCLDYYFNPDNRGFHVKAISARVAIEMRRNNVGNTLVGEDQILLGAGLGFRWFPTDTGLFAAPFFGLGAPVFSVGDRTIGGQTYDPPLPIAVFPALFIGYEFG